MNKISSYKILLNTLFLFTFFLVSCNIESSKKTTSHQKKEVSENIAKVVHDSLKGSDSISIIAFIDNYHCLNANSKCIIYGDGSSIVEDDVSNSYFAFAFFEKESKSIKIKLLEFMIGSPSKCLELILKEDDTFSSNLYVTNKRGENDYKFTTKKSNLVVDSPFYSIGDTIRGHAYYKGNDDESSLANWEFDIFFQCVLSENGKLSSIITSYPICKGYW